MSGGSSKNNIAAPDYTPLAEASIQSAQIMSDLGYAQMSAARSMHSSQMGLARRVADQQFQLSQQSIDQQGEYLDLQRDVMGRQLALAEEAAAQGKDYYDYMKETFRPLEKKLVEDALKFNSRAEFERQGGEAAADVQTAGAQQRAANERAMAGMGVNPNSGRFASMAGQQGLQMAGMAAGAKNQARNNAQMVGYARMMDATGLGRGLPGASQGAYALAAQGMGNVSGQAGQTGLGLGAQAINAGNSALQNYMAPGAQYMNGLAQGAATIGSGQSMMLGGLGTAINGQASAYNAQQDANAQNSAGFGSMLGTLGGAAIAAW